MHYKTALLGAAALLPAASLAQISEGFESGWDQTKWPVYAPDCNQGGAISLDSTTAHTGKNSLKVAGAGGYCGHIFAGTTAIPSGDLYVRTWLKATTALTNDHVSFITMTDASQATNKHLRIGGQNSKLMWNQETTDATLPDQSPQGVATSQALPTNTWTCFEYLVGTNGTFAAWLNGAIVPGMSVGPSLANANGQQWAGQNFKPKVTGVYFGWESYGGGTNTFWYDDIVVASSRIGC